MELLFNLIFVTIGIYLLLNVVYLLFFAIAGHIRVQPVTMQPTLFRNICLIFPAYKEDNVILDSVAKAKQHQYSGTFDICVVADSLLPQTVSALRAMEVQVLEVNFNRSTKGKALAAAMHALPAAKYDIALVLDADNQMSENYLEEVNIAFEAGERVVQTHRTAKNTETSFAFLDSCNEEINNHIYRKGHYAIGMSPALIGSGMAFEFRYLRKLLVNIGETVGEDKELDFRIAKDQVKIAYLDHVLLYDEKTENAQAFTQQRTRWIAAQVELMLKYTGQGFIQLLFFGNVSFFNKFLQTFLVPRVLLLGVLGFLLLQSLVNPYSPPVEFWAILLFTLCITLFISLPGRFYTDKRLRTAIWQLPYAFFCMCLALLSIKKTKISFLPTAHKVTTMSAPVNSKR